MQISMKVNYHTHTARCGHANGEDREYVEHAIACGMKTLGFSDHAPFRFPDGHESGHRVKTKDAQNYIDSILALREEYKKDIKILVGFEMEYYPKYFDLMYDYVTSFPIDYLILGEHFIDSETTNRYSGSMHGHPEWLPQYVDEILEGLSTGIYSYLAHPDLANYTEDTVFYKKEMRRLCEGVKKLGYPLEINFLGLLQGRHYPCDTFFEIASETGCDIVLGCDAHWPGLVDDREAIRKAEDFCEKHHLHPLDDIVIKDPFSLKK